MIKYFCDTCGCEILKNKGVNQISYLCHLDDVYEFGSGKYTDGENDISGRYVKIDVCNGCYNKIMFEAVKKINEIKKL